MFPAVYVRNRLLGYVKLTVTGGDASNIRRQKGYYDGIVENKVKHH
jgi:hypothetical protein